MTQENQLKKVINIIDEIKIAMFVTYDGANNLRSRPMQTAQVEDDGTIWFFTDEYSGQVEELKKDNPVNLSYAHPREQRYLSVTGFAYLEKNEAKMKDLWNPALKSWFPKGLNDETISLIKVVPVAAEYWDVADNKLKKLFYASKAAFTGEEFVKGVHEKLDV